MHNILSITFQCFFCECSNATNPFLYFVAEFIRGSQFKYFSGEGDLLESYAEGK